MGESEQKAKADESERESPDISELIKVFEVAIVDAESDPFTPLADLLLNAVDEDQLAD